MHAFLSMLSKNYRVPLKAEAVLLRLDGTQPAALFRLFNFERT